MNSSILDMTSGTGPALPPILPGKLILNGENPFIRLSRAPGDPFTTDASLWTVTYSPRGAGHALFIHSELTGKQWRIYSDNPDLVRWLQSTVQGMLNPETASGRIAVIEAAFSRQGDLQSGWTQKVRSGPDEIVLVWRNLIGPLLMAHEKPAQPPDRKYGASVVMIPALEAELTFNGEKASGEVWPCRYDGQPFSTAALAFSESWRESAGSSGSNAAPEPTHTREAIRAAMDHLIDRATRFDVDALETIYHRDFHTTLVNPDGTVTTYGKAEFITHFRRQAEEGQTQLNSWADWHDFHVLGDSAVCVLTRKHAGMTGEEMKLLCNIEWRFEDGRWQVLREQIFLRPLRS